MGWDLKRSAFLALLEPFLVRWVPLSFHFADLWRRDLRCPIPVGASLGPVCRSTIMPRITWALTSHSFLQIFQFLRGLR